MGTYMEAFSNAGYWMKGFKRQTYEQYLEAFCQQNTESFCHALQENEPAALAKAILDELENRWDQMRFWNRSGAKTEVKLLLITYVSPMLLLSDAPSCNVLAEQLCRAWNERWPKDTYQLPDVEKLKRSFKNAIFGITLDKTSKRSKDES